MDDACRRFDALIARTGQLTSDEAAELDAHLAGCTSCRDLSRAMKPVTSDVAFAATGASDTMPSDGGDTSGRRDLQLPTSDRYRVTGEVGRGGIGRVLRALDQVLDRPVALKELFSASDGMRRRFLREALITARLQHPSIVPVYDAGHLGDRSPFYAMKLVAGRPLDQAIAEAKTLAKRLALLPNILAVADAMAYAHSERIIHRDLKPQNVLVGKYGETIVIDWGLAKDLAVDDIDTIDAGPYRAASLERTVAGVLMGTPAYMAPEQAAGEPLDERADVYALGAILYHIVSGAVPHEGTTLEEVVTRVIKGDVRPLIEREPEVPRDLAAIVTKAMAVEPSARYANAQGFADDLRRFLNGQLVGSHRYGTRELVRRWLKRHRAAVMVALAAAVIVGVVGIGSVVRIVRARDQADEAAAIATRERNTAAEALTETLAEQGRNELVAGQPARAAVYLSEAYARSHGAGVAVRSLLAEAMRSIEAQRLTLDSGGTDILDTATFSLDGTRILTTGSPDTQIWDSATGAVVATLRDEQLEITSASLSPDGSRIVTTGFDRKARLWDAKTGKQLAELAHDGSLLSAVFSPDGKRLVTTGLKGLAKLWDAETMQLVGSLDGHRERVSSAAFSADGTRIVTASDDHTAKVWDANTARLVVSLEGHGDFVASAMFSPDGNQVVTASFDGTAKLWDARSGRVVASLDGHAAQVLSAVFSRDGSHIATTSADRTARLWDARTAKLAGTLEGHNAAVHSAAFSPDGSRIVTASRDHTAKLWDVESGRLLASFEGHGNNVSSASFSPDGTQVLTASDDGTAKVWVVRPTKLRLSIDAGGGHPTTGELSPDGTSLVTIAVGDTTAKLWDPRTGKLVGSLDGHRARINDVGFDASGVRVITASADHTAKVWDVKTAKLIVSLEHPEDVYVARVSPDGARIVTTAGDGQARLWNATTGELIAVLGAAESDRHRFSVAFSPDSQRVLATDRDDDATTVTIWRTDNGRQITQFAQRGEVYSAAFSPDGERVVTASRDKSARIWDVTRGDVISVLEGHTSDVNAASFSPDGTRVVTASKDHTAKLWDAKTGKLLASLEGHTSDVNDATFSRDPEGTRVVTASNDRTAKVWDGRTGRLLATLDAHTRIVPVAAFSRDGTRVVTASNDGTVELWDVELEQRAPETIRRIIGDRDPWTLSSGSLVPVTVVRDTGPNAAPPPLPSGPVTSDEDYLTRLAASIDATTQLFAENDCNKLAATIQAFTETNKAQMDALVAWASAHKVDMDAMKTAIAPARSRAARRAWVFEKCNTNKAFTAAMKAASRTPTH